MNHHNKHLSEPWFTLGKLGLKTVEGRLRRGNMLDIKQGDTITFYNNDIVGREYNVEVTKITVYSNFKEYLDQEGLSNCLPGIDTIEDGLSVYYKYFSKTNEKQCGVVAINFT